MDVEAVTLKIVKPKKHYLLWLNEGSELIRSFILLAVFIPLIIIEVIPGLLVIGSFVVIIVTLKIISQRRFKILKDKDYQTKGTVILKPKSIEIFYGERDTEFDLKTEKIEFNYFGVRNESAGPRDVSRGIGTLEIDDQKFQVLLEHIDQFNSLKKIFETWYLSGVMLHEFYGTTKLRMIELNTNFEWKRLEEIKANKGLRD